MTLKLSFLAIAAFMLAACVQTPQPAPETKRKSFTSVSTSAADFAPKAGQRFAWYTPGVTWATTGPTELNAELEAVIKSTVRAELVNRGYVVTQDTAAADFIIGLVLTTNDYNHADDFAQYFNLNANMRSEGSEPIVKALMGVVDGRFAGITPPPPQALVWKADLETEILEAGTEKAIRLARAKVLTSRLLDSLPKGE
ncbi:DUF4136 domain-containing protein [Marinagarivorans cellulosilyticus]|uniref:DUF4136 domain-containing protein n=1 Tax=Marinagarivorans cellulosilyticus TaxID=2721545 RepID=A0AAN1WGQ9_9GAMM|nr:DUF4136 domain-containing protein [Marinagarivorans cellulosilyticus]BCD97286.1 hypothetical protein MARGE09_P1487 [Marinagarivorans cellulosilyticus]